MNLTQILSNPTALVSLLCIVGFVVAVNLPLLFPLGLGKMFEREARTWSKALRNGADVSERNAKQMDDLHKQVEELKKPPTTPEP